MRKLSLDPRARIIIVVFLNIVLFSTQNYLAFSFNNIIVVALFFFSGKYNAGIKVGTLLLTLFLCLYLSNLIPNEGIRVTMSLMFFLFLKCIVVVIAGYWFTLTTKIGDFISSLQSARISKGVIITFSVVFRFLPTVKQEFWYIKSTMKLRGVSLDFKNTVTHPVRTMEYALIPLIMRSMIIANKLSASAMTRGLDLENERTSYNIVKLKPYDFLVCIFIMMISASSFFFEV